jgi:hypothetical protein
MVFWKTAEMTYIYKYRKYLIRFSTLVKKKGKT